MDNPFISSRKYIKWGDEEIGENTNTLVLTTRSKHYLDIRTLLPLPLPNDPSDPTLIQRLEWAFAGTCSSTPAKISRDGEVLKPAHTVWKHWVDSRVDWEKERREWEEGVDEGDMYLQSDGSVLEYGKMHHPTTQKLTPYEECWEDVETHPISSDPENKSWVLICDCPENAERGMLIRVGEIMQGLVKGRKGTRVVRWEWKTGEDDGEWERVLALGRLEVPGVLFEEGKDVGIGEEFMGSDGLDWRCVESFEWS